ncbi:energy transducer TonB [Xanthovirga aplysinae]|uniref:energy transducer TonB n=1 Tax=Xanthovirga aplysinae TaxID=2529853 RepID=UPI0012BBB69A|nr:energy transducer TonB [Xanthovirga aplysinae]MTI30242.1 energy transducer TonB [Xanthovirga aplysinae]
MEVKKNPKADLKNQYGMLLALGVVVSLSLIITAFEWKTVNKGPLVDFFLMPDDGIEIENIPITEFKRPKPPKVMPIIKPVEDEKVLEEDKFVIDDEEVVEVIGEFKDFVEIKDEEIVEPPFVLVAEVQPEYKGGMRAFYDFVGKNLKYPPQARRMGIEGRVFVSFIVDKDGSIVEAEILKGIGAGCDEEALRVISNSKKWLPGKQRGRTVRVKMSLPIIFKLQ